MPHNPAKGPRPPRRTSALKGPFCGAKRRRRDTVCKLPAGFRTDHPGQGRCYLHGGASKVTSTGRYSKIIHHTLAEKLEELSLCEKNVMDLAPEAELLRTLVADYINRYDDFVDALLAWYADGDTNQKPRRIMDLADCARMIESISRVVYRIHQMQSQGAISMDTFRRVTETMGVIVARHVNDDDTLKKIEADWSTLALDARHPVLRDDTESDDADAMDND